MKIGMLVHALWTLSNFFLFLSLCSTVIGYIQTPDFEKGTFYVNNMKSCVTLYVPHDHVIMLSLGSLDLERPYDYLRLYFGQENCNQQVWWWWNEIDTYIPPNIRLINPISKRFTNNRRFTSNKLPTWVEQSQKLMLRSTVSFLIFT